MKKLLLILLFLVALSSFVFADVVIPGQKEVYTCYEIVNMEDFPDYTFILYDSLLGNLQLIEPGECFNFYKLSEPFIYAVMDYDEDEFSMALPEEYLASNGLKSDLVLGSYGTVDSTSLISEVAIKLEIVYLDEIFVIEKSSIVYTFSDGTTEELPYQSQDVIPPPSKERSPWITIMLGALLIFALAVPAIIVIIIILLIRKK